jgi:uncharacterized membrane protein
VIALGYGIGPWFGKACDSTQRRHHLLVAGVACLLGFAAAHAERVWRCTLAGRCGCAADGHVLVQRHQVSAFTVVPAIDARHRIAAASAFEKAAGRRWLQLLATLGAAPMFFYVLHLYVLKFMYLAAMAVWGPTRDNCSG